MLRQMRQSLTMAGDDEEDKSTQPYGAMTDTMDTELAQKLSQDGGLGIADVIIQAFTQQQHDARAPVTTAAGSAPVPVPFAPVRPAVPLAQPPTPLPAASLPVSQHVTSGFGWRHDPLTGETRFHKGVDLRAAYGQPVASVAAGRVVQAGPQGGYGLSVVVEHGSGIRTRYAHLSEVTVRQGDAVTDGETVGKAGQYGRSTGPHLHFEILAGGRPVDPVEAAARFRILGELKPIRAVTDSPNGWPSIDPAVE